MGCTFTVSLDELRQVGTTLATTASELAALGDVREDCDCILGSDDVRHEVHSFFQHWSDGMHRIADHVKDLADHVNSAVDAYEETENALIANATPAR
jgi:hypothetical protein